MPAKDPSVYKKEQKALENRPRGSSGGGGDFTWIDFDKPATKGATTQKRIRVIDRLPLKDDKPDYHNPEQEFWVRVDVHKGNIEGKFQQLVCPEDHDVEGWRDRANCPVCLLQKELWAAKRDDWNDLAKEIGCKTRVYCNVIDLDDAASHWVDDGNGGWKIRPKVWGFSYGMHKDLMRLCVNNGPIEDVVGGQPLIVEIERTGPKKMNIKYSLTGLTAAPLDEQLMPIVWNSWDLESLRKSASAEDLRAFASAVDPRPAGSAYRAGAGPRATPVGYVPPVVTPPPPAGPQSAETSAPPPPGYQPRGGYEQSGPPPLPGSAAPSPPPSKAAIAYNYSGPSGQSEGLSASEVAIRVNGAPDASHHVWTAGMPGWEVANNRSDIQQAIQELQPEQRAAPPPPPASGLPAPPQQGGPPMGPSF